MLDAHGNLKGLSHDMGVLYQHIESHSKGGSDKNGFFKSIFGTSGMNGAMILAKSSKEVEGLTKRTEKAGKTGTYVSKLAAKNMGTAQGSANSARQAMNAFKMTLGNAVLPAINKASNELAKFLLSKDGKKFQKDVGGAVGYVANKLVAFIKWSSTHKKQIEWIGKGLLVGYSAVKAAQFISFLGKVKAGLEAIRDTKLAGSLFGTGEKAGIVTKLMGGSKVAKAGPQRVIDVAAKGSRKWYQAPLESARHAGGFKNLTTLGKIANVGAGVGVGIDAGTQVFSAIKNRHNAEKRSQDIGGAVGTGAGGLIGLAVGGPMGAAVGAQIGKVAGRWGGHAVNQFTKGWQKGKPPKNFWSLENLGWSTHSMFKSMGKGWNQFWGGMGNWRKKQAAGWNQWTKQTSSGIGRWASNVGKGWNKGVKSVKKWIHDIPSNLGKAGNHIKGWATRTGNNIHKGWNKGIKASHNFFKNIPKNTSNFVKSTQRSMSKFGRSVQKGFTGTYKKARGKVHAFGKWYGKTWSGIFRTVNNNRYVKAFKKGQLFQTAFKDMKSRWNGFSKWFGKGWNSFWKQTKKWATSSWNGTKRNWNSFWGAMPRKWNAFKKSFGKGWNSFWGGVGSTFSNIVKGIEKAWNNSIGGIIKAWKGFTGKLGAFGKWAKNSWTGTKNNVKGFANDINYAFGGSKHKYKYDKFAHANGGTMHTSHGALVGEAGPELAYKPYANHVRLLGANGPQFTKVHAGEHILNARDTAKVLNGGLGNGLTLKGYANGTDKLGKTSKKVTNDYKQIADKSSKSLNSLSKKSSSTWNKITRQTGKDSSKTRKRAISDYSDMHKGIVKQMDKTHDGVISLSESTAKGFGKALGKTKGYARDAMSDSIGEINKGITGIDKVLGQFGGNTSVIKPVKFATGTDANGRLTENTLAMVNDAQTGPRQEALVSDKNELFLPRGKNVTMMLPKGWGVLNGTQTQQVAKSAGVKHFAKGSGLSHSALRKLAEKAGANPAQSFKEMYLDKLKPSGSNLKRGSIGLAQNSSQHFGNPWSNAMWTVINDAIGDSSKNAKGLLKAVEKNGEGHKYVWGAAGPSTFDCSGLVMYTLKHDYGIDYPHFSGAQYARTQHISKNDARMGDLVFWGPGDHVGVYAGGNKYFSAESPSQGIHMNTLSSVVGHGSPMFGRVKGIKNDFSKTTRKKTADKALINLAKRELGASALKWIKDKLGDEMGSLSNPSGDGVARWRSVIERAARVMHVSLSKADLAHILNVTAHESGGNPKAVNGWDSNAKAGTPSKGVIQFIQPTFDHYAVKGHHNILNGYDQYLAMFNDKTWRRDLTLGGWGPTGAVRGYAKGGRPKAHTPFIAGERGPELITADGPVKVDSHEQTKRKVSDLAQMFKFPKINRPTRSNSSAPVININFNGPIYGTKEEAKRIAELVRREINKVLVNIGDEFGTDPSLY